MLGSLILYFRGMRLMLFQLSGFYFNTFFLKEPLWNESLYFFLPGCLKAQEQLLPLGCRV